MADAPLMGEARIATAPGEDHARDWPLRPWLLAGLLALAGLLIHFATDFGRDEVPWRVALASFLFFGSLSAAFSLERGRWIEVAIFAFGAGLVMAGLAWLAVDTGGRYADEQFGFAAGVFATLLALPLFQAGFHRTRFATPYGETHFFVWTDAVSAAGALAFTGLSWVLLALLAQLFELLQIDLLSELMGEGWFGWSFSGAAFGAALGVLRNQLRILGTLQSVVLLVLSLLAVPLAAALVVFLLAMIVSGPDVLWEATRSATPVLLACAAGAFILANAIIREDDTDMTGSPVMRVTALVLALGILPLTVFAAISMGTRIAQHGLSPERLWALVAIAVACAYGLAALVSVIRGRLPGWRGYLRRSNLNLAVGVSALALLLALPILDFGGISASNQLSRLRSGAVDVADFDYDALRWDFGKAGERALEGLAKDPDAEIARLAKAAQERSRRPWRDPVLEETSAERLANLDNRIEDPARRDALEQLVRDERWRCMEPCVALDLGSFPGGDAHLALLERGNIQHFRQGEDGKLALDTLTEPRVVDASVEEASSGTLQVEVRPYQGRQVYVDGEPVGAPFE